MKSSQPPETASAIPAGQGEVLRNRLAAIVQSSDDAIVSKSLEGVIESWNQGAERIFGYSAAEAVGRSITLIIPAELLGEEARFLGRLRRGERIDHYETVRVAKDGRRIHVSLTISPVRDGSGQIVGASKIARDITARKEAEAALLEADRRKDEFLAVLAHELRNPLAPIRNGLNLLRLVDPASEQAAKARGIIERQVEHMVRLVDDLLEVSRISRGKVELRAEPVELSAVLLHAVETSRPRLEARRHRFDLRLPPDSTVVNGDFIRLSQIVSNLLNNAAKFTPPGGTVTLESRQEGGWALVEVRDSGPGIRPEVLPRIFEMFSQVEDPAGRPREGLGIGLGLARSLTELHGGTIEARSDGPGTGATFTVRLPATRPPAQRAAGAADDSWAAAPDRPRRVLVADDNVDAAQTLAMMLESMGHRVTVVYDGAAALVAARATRPEVIFLDISMPSRGGLDVVRELRREPGFERVRFAAITGLGRKDDIERSRLAGFDEHLVKPVSLERLQLVLEQ